MHTLAIFSALPRPQRICRCPSALAAAALILLLDGAFVPLRATTLARLDLRHLALQSSYIVRARCLATVAQSSSGQVWTLSTFAVTETWKGAPPSPFTVRLPGGDAAGLRVSVDGAPRFAPGEDVVLFLFAGASGHITVVGWVQGTFRIRRNLRTGAADAVQDAAGLALLESRSGAAPSAEPRRLPLASLRARVAAALRQVSR